MPAFLEKQLKEEYGQHSPAVYKVMNAVVAMKGNKETPKGEAMQAKHEADMKKHKGRVPHNGKFRKKDVESSGSYGE